MKQPEEYKHLWELVVVALLLWAAFKPRHPGATVLDGMRHYDAHLKELSKTVPFSILATEISAEYKRRIEAGEVRGLRHVETLNGTSKKLELRFGNTPVSKISKQDLETWLKRLRGKDGEPLAAKTRNKHRDYAGQIFLRCG